MISIVATQFEGNALDYYISQKTNKRKKKFFFLNQFRWDFLKHFYVRRIPVARNSDHDYKQKTIDHRS